MTKETMKTYSTLQVIKEMQIKTMMRYDFISTGMVIIRKGGTGRKREKDRNEKKKIALVKMWRNWSMVHC